MPETLYRMEGQSKEMEAARLWFEQRKIILKWYWEFEKCVRSTKTGAT
jgi:hypothetical protein